MAATQSPAQSQDQQRPPYHPLQNEYNHKNQNKEAFMKQLAMMADRKINNFIKEHFSDQTQSEMMLFDHLKLKMKGRNIAAQILVSRIIDGIDWDREPARCQEKIKQVLPVFGSLMEYCSKQTVLNEHTVRIDLVYDDGASFTKMSHLENAEMFYLAIKKLEQKVQKGHAQNDRNLLRLNEHFVARAWQRKPIGEIKKFVMSGAYIAKQLRDGRKESLDVCAKEVADIISRFAPSSKVYRLGGLRKKYILDILIIEVIGNLDVKALNAQHRRICGQLVQFKEYEKKQKETKTEQQQLEELSKRQIKFGKKLHVDCNQRIHQLFDDDANRDEEEKRNETQLEEQSKQCGKERQSQLPPYCPRCSARGHPYSECPKSRKRKAGKANVDQLDSIAKRTKQNTRNSKKPILAT